jgi:hypothetical protein
MLRFTIRDVQWLTVVVAMGCGWYLNDRSWRVYERAANQERYDHVNRLDNRNGDLRDEILLLKAQHYPILFSPGLDAS